MIADNWALIAFFLVVAYTSGVLLIVRWVAPTFKRDRALFDSLTAPWMMPIFIVYLISIVAMIMPFALVKGAIADNWALISFFLVVLYTSVVLLTLRVIAAPFKLDVALFGGLTSPRGWLFFLVYFITIVAMVMLFVLMDREILSNAIPVRITAGVLSFYVFHFASKHLMTAPKGVQFPEGRFGDP